MSLLKRKHFKYPTAAIIVLLVLVGAWLLWLRVACAGDAAFLSAEQKQLDLLATETINANAAWRGEKLSNKKLVETSTKRQAKLHKIISELEGARLLRCNRRRAGSLIAFGNAILNHDLSGYHCARAVLFSPIGKQDATCYPYNLRDTFNEIESAKSKIGPQAGLLKAAAAQLRTSNFPRKKPARPNVIIILLDAARADSLYAGAPFIDGLAKEGLRFDDALSESSFTQTSVATLLTGTSPFTHGLIDYHSWRSDLLISNVFRKAGWQTAAFSANSVIWPNMLFGDGFDRFHKAYWLPGEALVNDASTYVASEIERSKPQFMYFHFIDPHDPYFSPDTFNTSVRTGYKWPGAIAPGAVRAAFNDREIDARGHVSDEQLSEMKRNYADEIKYTDRQVESLFAELRRAGLLDNALVIITADHGEEFLEHGGVNHSRTLYREVTHIPLVVWGKIPEKWRKAHDARRPVGLIDVAPTVLDFAGISPPKYLQGKNMFEGGPPEKRYMVVEGVVPGMFFKPCLLGSVVDGHEKLITCFKENKFSLFDIGKDPGELKDLSLINQSKLAEMKNDFILWHKAAAGAAPAGGSMLNQRTINQLKSLGYIK